MSIVTVTFSPAIDKSSSVPEMIPEKKLKCTAPHLEAGGGGIIVARALRHLGVRGTAVFPSGGFTGKYFNRLLEKEGVPAVIINCENEMRENFVILDGSRHQQYRFGMPGTALLEKEWKQMLKAIEEMKSIDFLVASGSLPPGVPDDVYAQLALIARKKKAKYIVDVSGEPLKHALDAGVYLVKPNLGELSGLHDGNQLSDDQAGSVARDLVAKKKCEVVVISMGSRGAMLVTENEQVTFKTPEVVIKSTVGAGDSMVAGIVFSLANGKSLQEAVHYGVACGTAATLNPGTALFQKEDVEKLLPGVSMHIQKG